VAIGVFAQCLANRPFEPGMRCDRFLSFVGELLLEIVPKFLLGRVAERHCNPVDRRSGLGDMFPQVGQIGNELVDQFFPTASPSMVMTISIIVVASFKTLDCMGPSCPVDTAKSSIAPEAHSVPARRVT